MREHRAAPAGVGDEFPKARRNRSGAVVATGAPAVAWPVLFCQELVAEMRQTFCSLSWASRVPR
eukprot:10026050-Lingulodinium_polyedra.AAC.1